MATAWFLVPFETFTSEALGAVARRPAIFAYDDQITANGGVRSQVAECLGDHGLVKVVGPQAGLDWLAQRPGFVRLPQRALDTTLGDLTALQRQAILTKLAALGYTTAQITNALPDNWRAVTLRQIAKFLLSRWRRPGGYDVVLGEFGFETDDFVQFRNRGFNVTLGSLSAAQRQALRDLALSLGFSAAEIDAAIPRNWATITLRQLLRFLTRQWTEPLPVTEIIAIFGIGAVDVVTTPVTLDILDAQVGE